MKSHVINVKGLAKLNKKYKNNVTNMIDFLVKTVKPTHYQFLQSQSFLDNRRAQLKDAKSRVVDSSGTAISQRDMAL